MPYLLKQIFSLHIFVMTYLLKQIFMAPLVQLFNSVVPYKLIALT